ncbi:MAG: putative aminohydrolase SsnA [Verrucomicrobiota bacterium]
MSSLLIRNGRLVTLNERNDIVEGGSVYVEGAKIVEAGSFPERKYPADRVVDAGGRVVMPGLINAHHHLYSTFARGFAPPGKPAENFQEILEHLWWKLDHALDAEDVYLSAVLSLIDCIRSGCTTVIDHHASPSCCDGSLDLVEKAFREAGLNGCLCYEVSDRNGEGGGIEENERFIRKCAGSGDDQITALFGLHASMTLGEKTLARCAEVGRATGAGFHVHAAEDEIDQKVTQKEFGQRVMNRFRDAGITGPKSIFVHGIHLNEEEMEILDATHSMVVHNPESNMNNAVGAARVLEQLARRILVGLGTDGMSSWMIASARAAYLLQRHATGDPRVGFVEACGMLLKNNRTICERVFKEKRGMLAAGHLADVIVVDYTPFTPFTPDTLCGHLLYGLNYARVDTTVCRGRVLMEQGKLATLDEKELCAQATERAAKLWKRIR